MEEEKDRSLALTLLKEENSTVLGEVSFPERYSIEIVSGLFAPNRSSVHDEKRKSEARKSTIDTRQIDFFIRIPQ